MGSSSSRTRKLTVENDEPTSVIKVSEDVVHRLKGHDKKETTSTVRNANSNSVHHHQQQQQRLPVIGTGETAPLGGLHPLHPSYFREPILTSLQIRQDKEAALLKNDQYWEQRINDLEKAHCEMHQVMQDEYKKVVQEVAKDVEKKPGLPKDACGKPTEVPCHDRKKAVVNCYQLYAKEPIRCAKEVEEFTQCVDKQRTSILIANRG